MRIEHDLSSQNGRWKPFCQPVLLGWSCPRTMLFQFWDGNAQPVKHRRYIGFVWDTSTYLYKKKILKPWIHMNSSNHIMVWKTSNMEFARFRTEQQELVDTKSKMWRFSKSWGVVTRALSIRHGWPLLTIWVLFTPWWLGVLRYLLPADRHPPQHRRRWFFASARRCGS